VDSLHAWGILIGDEPSEGIRDKKPLRFLSKKKKSTS